VPLADPSRVIHTDVAIVGGGPVGVALAILLARRGIRSTVVERHAEVYPLPRAVHLDDEVYRILDDLGIADAFARISRATAGLRLVGRKHRRIAEFERAAVSASGLPEANLFDQPELEELLRAELGRHGEAERLFGWEATRLEQSPDDVALHATSGEEQVVVRARYLVGCDGANSWTRSSLGLRAQNLGFEQRWLVIDGRCEAELEAWGGVYQICDPRRPGTFMRVGPDRYRWEFRLDQDESAGAWDEARVRTLLAPWTTRAGDPSLELLRTAVYTFRAEVADRWRDRRVLLAGDAAHLTPPFIGQGLGAGLRDAANLAWKLAAVLEGRSSASLLDSYEAERRPHAVALIRKAMMIGRVMTGRDLPARVVRNALMPLAGRVRPVRERVLSSSTPPLTPVTGRPRRRGLAGALVPRVDVEAPEGAAPVSLDALVRDRIVVLSLDGAAPAAVEGLPVISISRAGAALGGRRLATWLRRGGSRWAIVRPDRAVLASGRDRARLDPRVAELVAQLAGSAPVPPRL
jgi:3-(3-hydroxy-phenyl)propionate hydroxylase